MKRVAILGATGSIGTNCFQVLASQPQRLELVASTAHRRWRELAEQSKATPPRWAVVTDAALRDEVIAAHCFSPRTEVLFGEPGIERVCSAAEVDVVVSAIVGAAGLRGTWVALESGKTVAIANKETLVVAGPLVMELAKRKKSTLLPVDSEHSAIFQALQAGQKSEVRRVVLTSSGGPFRGRTLAQLQDVTPSDALTHPTWDMGPKITIDSATMMNKALEVIEAKWLFGLRDDQIDVVVHPQSIVHSFVEFVDGSVIAQLSPPDMRLPIQYALTYPDRCDCIAPKLDWRQSFDLHFEPPDLDAFPALRLGFEVASRGGTCGAVLNAANEAAVAGFLAGQLRFCDIAQACRAILDQHTFDPSPNLTDLMRLDQWAREEVALWMKGR